MGYKEDVTIDPNSLDVEWIEQPKLIMKWGGKLAEQERTVKHMNEKLKTLRSVLMNKAAASPVKYLGKGINPTGGNLESYYRAHTKYKELKKEVHEEELERDLLQVAVSAMHQRKPALENLVRLLGQSYFSAPKEPHNLKGYAKEAQEGVIRKKKKKKKKAPQDDD